MLKIVITTNNMRIYCVVQNRRASNLIKSLLRDENKTSTQGILRLVASGQWKPAKATETGNIIIQVDKNRKSVWYCN